MINPLMGQKSEIEKMNKLIALTNRFSYLFKLPTTMQSYLAHNNIEGIVDLYKDHNSILSKYSTVPVF